MPGFKVTHQINAPVEKVWEVLAKFGDIAAWSVGVKSSALTSDGPVAAGTTRHCDFAPMGGVEERIETYVPNERMTVNLYETSKLPISGAVADFTLAPGDDGTELTINYNYTLNRMGRVAKGTTDKQMRKGMNGLAGDLQRESERVAAI
ncbi:MAG: hypothetical protein ACI8Y4_004768 [Candidatus Poriferisodalaceae bacterium]|jgi:uncharacterized protein YndB with AHSA1/START domain